MATDFDKTGNDFPLSGEGFTQIPKQQVLYPRLEVLAGPEEGRALGLEKGECVLGRSKQARIQLTDTSISRKHAQFTLENTRLTVKDLGSRNGLRVNGKKVAPEEEKVLQHMDHLKAGIYLFRVALREVTREDEAQEVKRLKAEKGTAEATFVAQPKSAVPPPPAATPPPEKPLPAEESTEKEKKEEPELPGEFADEPSQGGKALVPFGSGMHPPVESVGRRMGLLFLIICLVSGLAGVGFFMSHRHKKVEAPVIEKLVEPEEEKLTEPKKETLISPVKESPTPIETPAVSMKTSGIEPLGAQVKPHTYRLFLDVTAKPLPARISVGGKDVGVTPLKASVELVKGQETIVTANFDLRDVHDQYQQKITLKADLAQEVVPLIFDAEIGAIKVNKLPRGIQFYLEGYYAYDKLKAHAVKLQDILYGHPIYLPFGHYFVELRQPVQVGDGQSMVNQTRLHREFDLNASNRLFELSVADRDLDFFPAEIKSQPPDAQIFVDDKLVGSTPFKGELPQGTHRLMLRHDGYFDEVIPLQMNTNILYQSTLVLKTSKAGESINKAKDLKRQASFGAAIDKLVEALQQEPTALEKAQIHYELGNCYLAQGQWAEARDYFSQVGNDEATKWMAELGSARALLGEGETQQALEKVVNVILNVKDDSPLHEESNQVFKKISPLKSVIYLATDPAGATVWVNGQAVDQVTPLLLSDLGLGTYRLEIEKVGFEAQQVKRTLRIGEFLPVLVKLKPAN